jgi:hypothetical protein
MTYFRKYPKLEESAGTNDGIRFWLRPPPTIAIWRRQQLAVVIGASR